MFHPEIFQEKYGAVPAQSALVLLDGAKNEAIFWKRDYLDTEALLIGALREDQTKKLLESLGLSLNKVRVVFEGREARGTTTDFSNLYLSPGVEKVLTNSAKSVEAIGLYAVRSVDILLALASGNVGVGAGVLEDFQITRQKVDSAIAASSIDFV